MIMASLSFEANSMERCFSLECCSRDSMAYTFLTRKIVKQGLSFFRQQMAAGCLIELACEYRCGLVLLFVTREH